MRLNTLHILRTILATALVVEALAIPCAMRAWAQDPFAPAGGAPAAGGDPFDKGGTDKSKGAKPADSKAEKQEPLVVRQFRESNPTTPEQLVVAAEALLNYGRPDETKAYLAKLLAAKPDEAALVGLHHRFGAGVFLRFSQELQTQPEGKQVADLVLNAAQKAAQSPAQIEAAIKDLSHAEPHVQGAALVRLKDAGPNVVTPLLRVLADAGRESEHKIVRQALVAMGPLSEEPLLGALETPNDYLRPQIIAILGKMESRSAVKFLIRPAVLTTTPKLEHELARASLDRILGSAPTLAQGQTYLREQIDRLLIERPPFPTDADGNATVWDWDTTQNAPLARTLPAANAALALSARLADDLHALRPQDPEVAVLRLLRQLELAQVLAGFDRPLAPNDPVLALAKEAGPGVISDVLGKALQTGRTGAAIAAAQILGQIGDASLLHAPDLRESPLAGALQHPDSRVRFHAAQTIVQFAPQRPFPGASRVAETLSWIASTSGVRRALVGHPRAVVGQSVVGFLNELGYEADTVLAGRQLVAQAVKSPDYELVLLSDALDRRTVQEVAQVLRKDYRTARLPIGIMARSEDVQVLSDLFIDDPLTIVFPQMYSIEVAADQIPRLAALAGRNATARDERIDQAQAALASLAALAQKPANFSLFGLLRHETAILEALNTPSLSAAAAAVLGQYGTAQAQTALVEFVSQSYRPLADRQAAAAAFAEAVKRRGIMLTTVQLQAQYERYNASETADKETQAVLGSILDTIEARAAVTMNP